MFKKFTDLFKSEDLLDEAFETTVKMLEFDLKMYDASRTTLRETDTAELPFDIKKADIKINKYEREVRRHVLTHLAVSGTGDLVAGLALVSIVIDVERIGDYTKNMYDLARSHPHRLHGGFLEDDLKEVEDCIAENFPKTIKVLEEQSPDLGREVMQCENAIGRKAEVMVGAILGGKDDSLTTQSAVALALYTRHLKRINAHLTNIASSIVNPFPRIGFREKVKKTK